MRPTQLDGGIGFNCTVDGMTGELSCWGDNTFGQLGDGTTDPHYDPVVIPDLGGVVAEFDAR